MGALTVTPNCTLLCACGAAYDINPLNGQYTPDQVFSPVADFAAPGPAVINNSSGDEINACLVGKNPEGIIVAFRGTLPPGTPDSLPDWLQDFFAEPISYNGLPGKVHSGFLDAVN